MGSAAMAQAAGLPSQGGVQPLMQVATSQPMMAVGVMAPGQQGSQDTAGTAGPDPACGQQQMQMKFDISQILSVIRNNMSSTAAPQQNNNE